jgi:hypothetical protein
VLLSVANGCKQNQSVTTGFELFRAARKRHGGFDICSHFTQHPTKHGADLAALVRLLKWGRRWGTHRGGMLATTPCRPLQLGEQNDRLESTRD